MPCKEAQFVMRKLVLAAVVMVVLCVMSLPAHADALSPANYLTLDDTLWELQNEIIEGIDHIGFYEDNIYAQR
jgi:hypothetical protein